MTRSARLWFICNEASGSHDDEAVASICERLSPERVFVIPREELPDAQLLAAGAPDILAIFTGDGTANAAIEQAEGFGGTVLMLPGGTTNLLSRSLHGEESTLEEILSAFADDRLAPIRHSLIQTSRGFAHSEVLAGPGAAWSDVRESMRDLDVPGMARTASEAIQQTTSGAHVVVVEPAIGSMEGYPALLLSVEEGRMRVDGYHAEGLGDYFRQGVAILMRDFRGGPHDELGHYESVLLRSNEPIELMIDGERCTGQTEERISLRVADLAFLSLRAGARG